MTTKPTPAYTPTKGDICYLVYNKASYRPIGDESHGAIVRITKARVNRYRTADRNGHKAVSSMQVEFENVEGFTRARRGDDELVFYGTADCSRHLIPTSWATPEQSAEFAKMRAKRAEAAAKAEEEREAAAEHERAFRAEHEEQVRQPRVWGEVIHKVEAGYPDVTGITPDEHHYTCYGYKMAFVGSGRDIALETDEEKVSVGVFYRNETFWDGPDHKPRKEESFDVRFQGSWRYDADRADALLRCLAAATAKAKELTASWGELANV